jgi:hypothetical protein
MATKKITELNALTSADDADVLIIDDVSESETKKITAANLLTGMIKDDDFAGSHVGRMKRTGAGTYAVVKDNETTTAPDENDDSSSGYSIGSKWNDTATPAVYECMNASVGAAVWRQLDAAAGAVMTSRAINTTSPLSGGGTLSGDLTLSIPAATASVNGYATSTQIAKLNGIEAGADVTDEAGVEAAGAVMDADFVGSHVGRMVRTGAGTYAVVKDTETTSAPGVNDDLTQGYSRGSQWIDTSNGNIYQCTDASAGEANWEHLNASDGGSGESPGPITASGTSLELSNVHDRLTIYFSSDSTVTVSVPSGLRAGVTVELVQYGDGQIQLQGTGSPPLTLRHPASFDPHTNEKYSSLVVSILDADEALVRGDMAAAA